MSRGRQIALAVALFAGAAVLFWLFARGRPFAEWLLLQYGPVLAWAALFNAGAIGVGLRLAPRVFGEDVGWPEAWLLGAFVASIIVFVLGLAGGLGGTLFVGLPLAMLAWGGTHVWRAIRGLTPLQLGLVEVLGLAALVFLFVTTLVPDNLNWDARWYHLGLAEEYASAGRIFRFPEGRIAGGYGGWVTNLATWAFCWPAASLAQRTVLSLQLELGCVAAAAGLVPSLCRALHPDGGHYRSAWVALFAFPAIFVYDSGVMGGADHAAMAWGTLAALGLAQLARAPSRAASARVILGLAGLLLTKHTAVVMALPGLALVVGLLLYRRAISLHGLARATGAVALLSAPFWLRNLAFYGDPLFPALSHWLAPRPWYADAPRWLERFSGSFWKPEGTAVEQAVAAARSLVEFHFDPKFTWLDFHGSTPAFGSLFTLSLPALLLLGRGLKRVWLLVAAIHAGVLVWFFFSHQERYLVLFVPAMAAVVAITLAEAVRWGGTLARAGAIALVGVQVLGALELPFLPTHRLNGGHSPIGAAVLSFEEHYRAHLTGLVFPSSWEQVAAELPFGAVVVPHGTDVHLGLERRAGSDSPTLELGFSYAALGSYPAIDAKLKSMGVTHLMWNESHVDPFYGDDSLASELLFRGYARLHATQIFERFGWVAAKLPVAAPGSVGDHVVVAACPGQAEAALFPLSAWSMPDGPSARGEPGAPEELSTRAGFAAFDARCDLPPPAGMEPLGKWAFNGIDWLLYARR